MIGEIQLMEEAMFRKMISLVLLLSFALAACAPSAPTEEAMMDKPTQEAMMDKPTEEAMMDKPTEEAMMDKPTEEAMMDKPAEESMIDKPTEEAMMDEMAPAPAWFSAPLSDVRSGASFTINDFKGQVVLVETLAMWCPSCKRQQEQVKALHAELGMEKDLVSIGLDIDPNEVAADLKAYIESNGFDWRYAIAPAEVTREIASLYGDQFLNPPSTPMLVIDRQGQAHPLPFGLKSAEELLQFLQPYLDAEM